MRKKWKARFAAVDVTSPVASVTARLASGITDEQTVRTGRLLNGGSPVYL
jgi:hypothetical protein